MRRQVAGSRARLAARLADMWILLPRMRAHVRHQASGLGERLAARLADVRLLTRMHPHVPSQVASQREGPPARLADVRLLACVCSHMPSHVVGTCECLRTTLVYTWMLFGTRWHVLHSSVSWVYTHHVIIEIYGKYNLIFDICHVPRMFYTFFRNSYVF